MRRLREVLSEFRRCEGRLTACGDLEREQAVNAESGVIQITPAAAVLESAVRVLLAQEERADEVG